MVVQPEGCVINTMSFFDSPECFDDAAQWRL